MCYRVRGAGEACLSPILQQPRRRMRLLPARRHDAHSRHRQLARRREDVAQVGCEFSRRPAPTVPTSPRVKCTRRRCQCAASRPSSQSFDSVDAHYRWWRTIAAVASGTALYRNSCTSPCLAGGTRAITRPVRTPRRSRTRRLAARPCSDSRRSAALCSWRCADGPPA